MIAIFCGSVIIGTLAVLEISRIISEKVRNRRFRKRRRTRKNGYEQLGQH